MISAVTRFGHFHEESQRRLGVVSLALYGPQVDGPQTQPDCKHSRPTRRPVGDRASSPAEPERRHWQRRRTVRFVLLPGQGHRGTQQLQIRAARRERQRSLRRSVARPISVFTAPPLTPAFLITTFNACCFAAFAKVSYASMISDSSNRWLTSFFASRRPD